jgi:DNA replication and repair protein RecF
MITSLRLQNFRNHVDSQYEFADGVNIIVGPNGSGKTSLLEAMLVVCSGSSYKADDESLVAYESDWCRVDAELSGEVRRSVKLRKEGDVYKKTYVFNEQEKQRFLAQQQVPVVLFEPQDMNVLVGEPSLRRDFLDAILCVTLPHYPVHLKNYKRILSQRNALLKRPTPPRQDELFVWDLRLSELGGIVHTARKALIQNFSTYLQETYTQISNKKDTVSISYSSDSDREDYAEAMLTQLHQRRQKDIERGFTTVGPHRDDFVLWIHTHEAKTSASRGETRSLLLSLKLLQIQELENAKNVRPIILLDDVFSELDGARRQSLAAALSNYQTFITTTDADLVIDRFTDKAKITPLS